jgi:hypothetical protein
MRLTASLLIALAVVLATGRAWSAGPPTLEDRAVAIARASKAPDGERVVAGHISRELRIPVETLRAQLTQTGLGWGELLIATRLARETRLTLDQVVGEFRSGKAWEEIARDHKADLDRLMRDVQRSQEMVETREEDKPPHTDTGDNTDRPGRAGGRPGGGMGRGRR